MMWRRMDPATRPRGEFWPHVEFRLFEWAMAIAMILLALECFIWPQTIGASAFHWMVILFPAPSVGVIMFLAGSARVAALIVNGRSPVHGPRIRAVGALVGALMWGQFWLALIMPFYMNEKAIPSPGIPFWFTFVLCELFTVYRAAKDVRSRSI